MYLAPVASIAAPAPSPSCAVDAAQHIGLALYLANKYRASAQRKGIDLDDLKSEALYGLVRAARRYDPSLGAKFSTLARKWIEGRLKTLLSSYEPLFPLPTVRLAASEGEREEDVEDHRGVPDSDLALDVAELLSILSPREKVVIVQRYGLDGDGERALHEIGQVLGVSRERTRQVLVTALGKLRSAAEKKGAQALRCKRQGGSPASETTPP